MKKIKEKVNDKKCQRQNLLKLKKKKIEKIKENVKDKIYYKKKNKKNKN
jgi:hypothetical protein